MAVYHLLEWHRANTEGTKVLTATIFSLYTSNTSSKVLIDQFTPLPPVTKLLSTQEQNTLLYQVLSFVLGADDVRKHEHVIERKSPVQVTAEEWELPCM